MDLLKKFSSLFGLPEKIIDAVWGRFYSTGSRLWNVEEEAEKLQRTERRIRALLTDAEQRRFVDHDYVKLWLQELRAAAFDVDTLLDRLSTMTAVSRMLSADLSRKRKRPWLDVQLGLRQRWELDARIAKINDRLDEIAKGRKNYRFQAGEATTTARPGQRTRFLEAAALCGEKPIGRNEEKGNIISALVSDSGMDVPVISIWGTPGVGKTTLARLVYGDPKVQSFFPVRIWVWLPDGCDPTRALKMIIEAVTSKKCDLLSLDILQQRLREHLSEKKFLLVIDNLWSESFQFWESLRPSLIVGEKGSKVLITTQNERVSRIMSNILSINLKGLKFEECWEILKVYAFAGSISTEQSDLESIGLEIAKKCQGSPLAAKLFGMLLSDNIGSKEQWESILGEMQILEDGMKTDIILAGLQLSYQHLPYHLKQCFAFCSVLPLDHEFEKDELVRLWIAEGLVKNNGRKRVEMEGGRYFDELLWRSFFLDNGDNKKYRVSRLMLDLARLVYKYDSLTLDPDTDSKSQDKDHPDWIRYLTILCPKDEPLAFDRISCYENLRFLKLCPTMKLLQNHIPPELFSKLTCLRSLDLSYTDLDILPDSVGCLIHLRYLSLRNTSIASLPEKVCDLFNLETLDLSDCYSLMDLPEDMSRLVNMRHLLLHLDWDKVHAFRSMPSGIDKLEWLQTLSRFVVVPGDGGGNCNIGELKNLKIRGELCILNLKATTSPCAKEANLGAKEYLQNLMLKWSDGIGTCTHQQQRQREIEESEKVIDALRPHCSIKRLRIENYPGRKLPSWVENLPSSLEKLEIVSCPRLAPFSVETLQCAVTQSW